MSSEQVVQGQGQIHGQDELQEPVEHKAASWENPLGHMLSYSGGLAGHYLHTHQPSNSWI